MVQSGRSRTRRRARRSLSTKLRGRLARPSFYIRPWLLVVAPLYYSKERELAGESLEEPLPVRFVPSIYTGFEL